MCGVCGAFSKELDCFWCRYLWFVVCRYHYQSRIHDCQTQLCKKKHQTIGDYNITTTSMILKLTSRRTYRSPLPSRWRDAPCGCPVNMPNTKFMTQPKACLKRVAVLCRAQQGVKRTWSHHTRRRDCAHHGTWSCIAAAAPVNTKERSPPLLL